MDKDLTTPAPEAPETPAPTFSLHDSHAADFLAAHPDLKLDDEVDATVKLKVTGLNKMGETPSLSFDVVSLDHNDEGTTDEEPAGDEHEDAIAKEDEEPAEESEPSEKSILGYERPKAPKAKVPAPKAKELED